MAALLSIQGLRTYIQGGAVPVKAVDGADLEIHPGELLSLVGESGCGKTMLALSIGRLLPKPAQIVGGKMTFREENLIELPEEKLRLLRGKEIAYIFQDPLGSLNPVMTIQEQLTETLRLDRKLSLPAARQEALRLLDLVRIPMPAARLAQYPHELSGGMRQRVMIAIALSRGPSLLIADEPTTALDVTTQAEILELLKDLQSTRGMAMLLITHDLAAILPYSSRVAVMHAGRIVETADRSVLKERPSHPYTQALIRCLSERPTRRRSWAPMKKEAPLLEVENLTKRYGWMEAVKNVSLQLEPGESVGLVGESGCGKSTLTRLLAKLELPTSGQIRYQGKPLESLRGDRLQAFRRSVGLIFQNPMGSLNPRMSVGQIIAEPLVIHRLYDGKELLRRTQQLLEEVGLPLTLQNRAPHTLSGGEQQRVGIARALSLNPALLICDEPVSSLDFSIQAQILKLFSDLQEKRNLTLLFISHNLRVVSSLCDRILVMRAGEILEEGRNPSLFDRPKHPYTQRLVKLASQTI